MKKLLRNCPSCNAELNYKKEVNKKVADKKGSLCKKCSMKEVSNRQEVKEKRSKRISGDKNPGYGGHLWKNRKHTSESIEKMRKSKEIPNPKFQSDEFRNKISELTKGDKNPMYGKSFYEVWLKKFGEEAADNKLKRFKDRLKIATKGKNNPMYGKIPSKNSGSGWGGWYNSIFFRSLHELSFLVNWVERFNLKIKSAETLELAINYNFEGSDRKYFADWLVNEKYLVEIKPKKLIGTKLNLIKFDYANKFCKNNNLTFKIIDPGIIHIDQFSKLYDNGVLVLTERTKNKFEKLLRNGK